MTRIGKLLSAALALSLLGGSAAMAQPAGRDFGRGDNRTWDHRGDRRDFDRDRDGRRDFDRDRDHDRFDRRGGGNFSFGFGYGPAPGYGYGYGPGYGFADPYRYNWRVGQRFSPYGARYYVVDDWYRYHLRRPPYGYHWVRVNNDYLLVGITSGIIADLLFNHY